MLYESRYIRHFRPIGGCVEVYLPALVDGVILRIVCGVSRSRGSQGPQYEEADAYISYFRRHWDTQMHNGDTFALDVVRESYLRAPWD